MPDGEFDMNSAVDEISAGLGLGGDGGGEAGTGGETAPNPSGTPTLPAAGGQTTTTTTSTTDDKTGQPAGITTSPPSQTAGGPLAVPRTWRAEAAALWAQVPPVVQAEIAKREEDIFKGIEGYRADAVFGGSMKNVLQPYMATLQQFNIKPESQVADMMHAHYTLAFGTPQQKLDMVARVLKDYSIDPAQLVAVGSAAAPAYVDPQVEALQNELREIKSKLSQRETSELSSRRQEIEQHVARFAADPANLYFEELAQDIAHLLRTGAEKSVEAAYETAKWRSPAVRQKELDRQQTEKAAADRKAAEEKAAAARKSTSANVRTSTRGGSASAPLGTMDDTLADTLAAIKARA